MDFPPGHTSFSDDIQRLHARKAACADPAASATHATPCRVSGLVQPGELCVRLQPAASPNRTRAIAHLCENLNATNTVYPGTQLRLRYAIGEA